MGSLFRYQLAGRVYVFDTIHDLLLIEIKCSDVVEMWSLSVMCQTRVSELAYLAQLV